MGLFGIKSKAEKAAEAEAAARAASRPVRAPVNAPVSGTLLRYKVEEGANVKKGDTVIIIESMNLELEVKTHVSGIINFIVEPNKKVQAGEELAIVRNEKQIEADAKAKAEAEAKAAAEAKAKEEAIEAAKKKLADEKAAKLAETQAALSQLENDLEAKKAELASLGLDAQGIVRKAALNKEIKELEPQVETLKAEVERLSK